MADMAVSHGTHANASMSRGTRPEEYTIVVCVHCGVCCAFYLIVTTMNEKTTQ